MLALKEELTISLWGNCFVCAGEMRITLIEPHPTSDKWRSVRSSARGVVAPVSTLWTSPEPACGNLSSRFLSGIRDEGPLRRSEFRLSQHAVGHREER